MRVSFFQRALDGCQQNMWNHLKEHNTESNARDDHAHAQGATSDVEAEEIHSGWSYYIGQTEKWLWFYVSVFMWSDGFILFLWRICLDCDCFCVLWFGKFCRYYFWFSSSACCIWTLDLSGPYWILQSHLLFSLVRLPAFPVRHYSTNVFLNRFIINTATYIGKNYLDKKHNSVTFHNLLCSQGFSIAF